MTSLHSTCCAQCALASAVGYSPTLWPGARRKRHIFTWIRQSSAGIIGWMLAEQDALQDFANRERGGRSMPLDRLPAPEPEYDDDLPF